MLLLFIRIETPLRSRERLDPLYRVKFFLISLQILRSRQNHGRAVNRVFVRATVLRAQRSRVGLAGTVAAGPRPDYRHRRGPFGRRQRIASGDGSGQIRTAGAGHAIRRLAVLRDARHHDSDHM